MSSISKDLFEDVLEVCCLKVNVISSFYGLRSDFIMPAIIIKNANVGFSYIYILKIIPFSYTFASS